MLEEIFKNVELEGYLKKYLPEIEELQKLHNDASAYGSLLLFSFTPEMLKESVYVSHPYGLKRTVMIDGTGETEDVKLILDTLRTTPEKIHDLDNLEYVVVATEDCVRNKLLQQKEVIKIIPFNAANPEKLALYEQKRDELVAKIKAEIEAERTARSKEQNLAHERKFVLTNRWFEENSCLKCTSSRVQEAD